MLKGAITALITPFKNDKVDYEIMENEVINIIIKIKRE